MFSQLPLMGGLLGALLLAVFVMLRFAKKAGRAEGIKQATIESADKQAKFQNEVNEVQELENKQIVEEVEKTHEVHDRLESDPAYRDSVRERFTRD